MSRMYGKMLGGRKPRPEDGMKMCKQEEQMTESKHTLGPWGIFNPEEKILIVHPEDGGKEWDFLEFDIVMGEKHLAAVHMRTIKANEGGGYPYVDNEEECRANARLIAAAPELLEACGLVCDMLFDDDPVRWAEELKELNAAIAAAKG